METLKDTDASRYRNNYRTDRIIQVESRYSGSFLLAALMWSAYTVSAFLLMLGIILPTWGNVFIVLVFLIVAMAVSFARNGGKT